MLKFHKLPVLIFLAVGLLSFLPSRSGLTETGGLSDMESAPASELASPGIRFAVIGDYGSDDIDLDELDVANLVADWLPDFIITVGDNRYDPATMDTAVGKYYCDFLTDVGFYDWCSGGNASSNAFFPSLGNHDYNDGDGLIEYLYYFTLPGTGIVTTNTSGSERYYDFVKGPIHFFVLDSEGAQYDSLEMTAQKEWLQEQLAASTTSWQVVYFHHAPYSSSSTHGSSFFMQWPFANWGTDVVLAGHDHTYERLQIDGIPYFVNGLGGMSRYDFGTPIDGSIMRYSDNYGAMLIDANDTSMTFQFVNVAGEVIDTHIIETVSENEGVLNVRVNQSSDDAEERVGDGYMYITSTDLEMVYDSWSEIDDNQVIGIRFQNVNVPQGAKITSAYLEFTTDTTDNVFTSIDIQAEAIDNAGSFISTNYNISSRPTTSASVAWDNIPAWNTSGEKHQSPDLSSVVQEIVDREGWNANNSMAFVISGTGTRTADSYDGSASTAPVLHLEFATRTLSITKSENGGGGTVTSIPVGIDCGTDCVEMFTDTTVVTLTASPDPNSKFTSWSGDTDCEDGVVLVNSDVSCTANFYRFPWPMFLSTITNNTNTQP